MSGVLGLRMTEAQKRKLENLDRDPRLNLPIKVLGAAVGIVASAALGILVWWAQDMTVLVREQGAQNAAQTAILSELRRDVDVLQGDRFTAADRERLERRVERLETRWELFQ